MFPLSRNGEGSGGEAVLSDALCTRNKSCQEFCAQRASVSVLAQDSSRESPRGFSKTLAIARRSLSTHCDTPRIPRVSADTDEQTTSTFFESPRSRRHFLATSRESLAARCLSALNVRESTWGFSEVGTAFSRSARLLRESACAFRRSTRPHRRSPGMLPRSPALFCRSAAAHRRSPCARSQSEVTYFDNETTHGDNPDPFFPSPFFSHNKSNPHVILSGARDSARSEGPAFE